LLASLFDVDSRRGSPTVNCHYANLNIFMFSHVLFDVFFFQITESGDALMFSFISIDVYTGSCRIILPHRISIVRRCRSCLSCDGGHFYSSFFLFFFFGKKEKRLMRSPYSLRVYSSVSVSVVFSVYPSVCVSAIIFLGL
jgi:hypothetical protein